ncbi:DUF1963 domain-containing protein [Paenibacillus sp. VCA1]|uniref:DUF1963 domain-containing protein n=1 Tax=Paenibacillus sp. VCA1 TaxID=3039148 RepID=UPI002871B8DB|nr:DUF1963 domain-containing protein [Paenibacillus sp. VCA1]MDR9855055.1 DUF1963 domain-containing protein [Paenibacillus sp. VCA1]
MTERIPCQSVGCKATILPATAAKTGGYCMPCRQEQQRKERQAYIEKHRKTVNLYENLTDPVDILKMMHTPKHSDPLVQYVPYPLREEEVYVSLSPEDAEKMLEHALGLLKAGDEETCRDILASLVCYRNENIGKCLPVLMEHGIYDPEILYKDAGPVVRDRLIERVESDDEHRNEILLVLGWIGDEQVAGKFRSWRMNRPVWAERLYVPPESYSLYAGWELDADGKRRNLVYGRSYAIRQTGESAAPDSVKTSGEFLKLSGADCPWCGGKLTTLMNVRTTHPSLAHLKRFWDRLQVDTCMNCGCFGVVYMDCDSNGKTAWSTYNRKPRYLGDIAPEEMNDEYPRWGSNLALSCEPRSAYYSSIWGLSQAGSQLGGHPSWIQDAEYPSCPCCGRSMLFIGQLDLAELEEYGEGIYYMFVCPQHKLTATTYQQS